MGKSLRKKCDLLKFRGIKEGEYRVMHTVMKMFRWICSIYLYNKLKGFSLNEDMKCRIDLLMDYNYYCDYLRVNGSGIDG